MRIDSLSRMINPGYKGQQLTQQFSLIKWGQNLCVLRGKIVDLGNLK